MPGSHFKIRLKARLGSKIGLGHWCRSLLLAQELQKRGHSVFLEPLSDSENSTTSLPENFGNVISGHADFHVVDDPIEPASVFKEGEKKLALDFYQMPEPHFDIICNIIDRTPQSLRNQSKVPYLVGLKYLILDPGADQVQPICKDERRALIVLGGKDTRRATLPILKTLSQRQFSENFDSIRVILPHDHPDVKTVSEILKKSDIKWELLPTQPSLLAHLRWATCVFCNGGSTAALTLLQRRPALFFPQSPEEEEFLKLLQADTKNIAPLDLFAALNNFTKTPSLPTPEFDGRGCVHLADEIEKILRRE